MKSIVGVHNFLAVLGGICSVDKIYSLNLKKILRTELIQLRIPKLVAARSIQFKVFAIE